MSMNPTSRIVEVLANGAVLDVGIEDLAFRAYVVVSEPDINLVAQYVPREQFEQDGDLHVTAVADAGEARQQLEDLAFNMNPGDSAVFLCSTPGVCAALLEELGQPDGTPSPSSSELN